MKKRNVLPVILMTSSIMLLLGLQTVWLVSSYDQVYNDLKRRTSDIFRRTVMDMRDSLFLEGMKTYNFDSLHDDGPDAMFFTIDSGRHDEGDTSIRRHHSRSRAEIFIAKGQSRVVKDLMFSRRNLPELDKDRIVVRITPDSLNVDSVKLYFARSLVHENLPLPFTVKELRLTIPLIDNEAMPGSTRRLREELKPAGDDKDRSRLATEWIRFSPVKRYAAVVENVRPYLMMKILPQILFSAVLTLITSAAFFMMYRSMRSQQKLMELKNDFISNITHELKTPVTTVSVALEALRNFKGLENPQTTREYLDIAQGELTRLTLLTDKVLKTAVFDNRGVNFEREQVDLRKTVDQILHSMKLIFEKQKANVTFEQHGNSFVIQGGSVHLTNVIYNLVDNALKYSVGEPQISIRLEEDLKRVILKVSDNGIGIPPEYKKRIFEKFFRVPTGDVHNIKGYGLGLSYVDSVIRSHKGLIEVASKPGEGSLFIISLPKG
jgi:two-component system phosphate regulon sensor histidine kinase PhoR